MKIKFGEFANTEITQTPAYPSESLFGDVGGTLGLFLGASLLTVVEVLDVTLVMMVSKIRGTKQ